MDKKTPSSTTPPGVTSHDAMWDDFSMELLSFDLPLEECSAEHNTDGRETTKEELDEYIGGVIQSLSREDRDQILEDLHGVVPEHAESQEQINELIDELVANLESIKGGSAYEIAESMDYSYVSRRDFRLMFLRSQRYEPRDAAKRMIAFFKMKRDLFGEEKLVQNITMADLDNDEKEYVKSGTIQIAPMFDAIGRQLVVQFPQLRRYKSAESELRARWYILMTLVKSQATQKRGVVVVAWMVGANEERHHQGGGTRLNAIFEFNTLPIHWTAVHLCYDDFAAMTAANASIFLMPHKTVACLRTHTGGTAIDRLHQLGSFGIPKEAIPLTLAFTPQLDKHLHWYNHHQLQESETQSLQNRTGSAIVAALGRPSPSDVLFGPKKKYTNGGNKRLRMLTKRSTEAYNRGHRVMKRQLIEHIVAEIKSMDGRFLRQAEGTVEGEQQSFWEEVPLEDVHIKIAQMFRNNRCYISKTTEAPPAKKPIKIFLVPEPRDVLFGRMSGNGGNQFVRELVTQLAPQYDAGSRYKKAELADTVFTEVRNTGGRFLVQNNGGQWEKASDEIARMKISKHFRNVRRPHKSYEG